MIEYVVSDSVRDVCLSHQSDWGSNYIVRSKAASMIWLRYENGHLSPYVKCPKTVEGIQLFAPRCALHVDYPDVFE